MQPCQPDEPIEKKEKEKLGFGEVVDNEKAKPSQACYL